MPKHTVVISPLHMALAFGLPKFEVAFVIGDSLSIMFHRTLSIFASIFELSAVNVTLVFFYQLTLAVGLTIFDFSGVCLPNFGYYLSSFD